jgi:NADPH-dependent glutamate synthase beta subunit-like oxidoreductase/CO/xanthine dehydrogenase FAD-binding subunit
MKYFEHVNAASFEEASALLKESSGKALALSGGTDLLGVCKDQILPEYPEKLVNLKTIPGYDKIEEEEGKLVVGAGARLNKLAKIEGYPALAEAAHSVASPLIRSIATVGGNICQDVRCWYYRYPDSIGGCIQCKRKGGDTCYAIQGENRYHSVFGGMHTHGSNCVQNCPASTDIPGYLEQLRAGDWEAAAETVMQANPFPMLTSRICPHPCQDSCNQRNYGDSVNIHAVERSVGDYILAHKERFFAPPSKETGKKIAVIGAGPGGLAAAYYLRKAGNAVTVFDKMEKAGGVLQYGIPHYRLPKHYVDDTLKAIAGMGVEFRLNTSVGTDISPEEIEKNYDSIYFGTGAWKQPILGIGGEELTLFGLNFLVDVNTYLEKSIGNNVLVCGGGNVAMDVALTAARLGAKNVKLVCLEQEYEMPASAEEVVRAREEGVQIFNGWGLSRVLTDQDGKVSGLEAKKCTAVFNEQHRFVPVYDEEEKAVFDSDYIILATGQRVDLDFLGKKFAGQIKSIRGLIDADPESGRTKKPNVYAGGDVVTGPDIAIRAIKAGRAAAAQINKDLGVLAEAGETGADEKKFTSLDRLGILGREANKLAEVPVGERTLTKEDVSSYSGEEALAEAGRCMDCGCYSVSPSDIAPVLVMLDAEIITTRRRLSAPELLTAGLSPQDILAPGELVKEIIVPKAAGISHYDKARVRDAIDFALVSLASDIMAESGKIVSAKLVFGGVAPVPYRVPKIEAFLAGKPVNDETADAAAELAVQGAVVMDDNEYKLFLLKSLLKQAILRVQ